MALCSGSLRPLISSWCATRDGGEGNPRCDAEKKRTLRLDGSSSLSDAADIDVAVVDQLALLIGVGIAVAAGEGSHGGAIFVKRAKARCPYCAPAPLGHASREAIL